jgi:hypothetical protein
VDVRVAVPVSHIDLGRTLLELAGLPAEDFPGANLARALDAAPATARFALGANLDSASVTVDSWHLILGLRSYKPKGALNPVRRHAVELYHLAVDPECNAELSESEHERARRMRELLLDWLAHAQPELAGEARRDQQLAAHLAELGYVGSDAGQPASELVDEACDCRHCRRFR